jgi:D-alanine-D-alanine ligase
VTAAPIALPALSNAPLLVWVLAPLVETDDADIAWYSDFSQSRAEYERAFAALGVAWRWQPVTMRDYEDVVRTIVRDSQGHEPVVFNLCDGDEVNGSPGLSVIRCLKAHGLRYTGADERFYDVTTSKIVMKEAFDRAGVPTSPWAVIPRDGAGVSEVIKRLGAPLILKPAVSAGSMGITTKSVCSSAQALRAALKRLNQGYHGWDVAGGGVFVERFVDGPEYTTFIVGSYDQRARATVYPPVERGFNPDLPATERFLSFDRLWGLYETEGPLEDDADLWKYRPVPRALAKRIKEISWAAYEAVGGRGYGRVDLREDKLTGEIHVLEVNAQCGISEDESYTSIGAILKFARTTFAHAVGEIIATSADPGVARPRLTRTRRAATR